MTPKTVTHDYTPREYFKSFHSRTQRFAVVIAHRRSGKTVAIVNDMVVRALRTRKPRWFGAYIAPYFGQAKQIAWAYLKQAVNNIPGSKIHESETAISFPNGSKIRVFGADNDNSLRGLYFDYVCLDEVAQIPRRVWTEVIRPALADRQGTAVFCGTPKGKNFFWELANRAADSGGKWFHLKLDVTDTKIIPLKELADIREDLDDSEYNQEFMVSFESALRGSYFGKQIAELESRGGITTVAYDPLEPVTVAMDVGHRDATSVWFWQTINGQFRVFDYFETTGQDAEQTVDMLELKPYTYDTVFLPHDAFHHTWASKKSGFDTFMAAGLPARRTPTPDAGNRVYHGIDACRKVLRTYPIIFDRTACARGLECLRNYSRKFDVEKKTYADTPSHDEWSHGADSFRYLSLAINPADIGRSIERSKTRAVRTISVNTPTNTMPGYTLGQALADHDSRLADTQRFRAKLRY